MKVYYIPSRSRIELQDAIRYHLYDSDPMIQDRNIITFLSILTEKLYVNGQLNFENINQLVNYNIEKIK